jgi:hypothetical protein
MELGPVLISEALGTLHFFPSRENRSCLQGQDLSVCGAYPTPSLHFMVVVLIR